MRSPNSAAAAALPLLLLPLLLASLSPAAAQPSNASVLVIAADDPAFYYSPYAWSVAPGAATTVNTGAYVRVLFAGAQPALLFDTSSMVDTASQVYWRIDEGPLTKVTLTRYAPQPPNSPMPAHALRGGAAGPNGTISVLEASYGVNCNAALKGDMTASVGAFCNGTDPCSFQVCNCENNQCAPGAPPCVQDPAQGCAKDFSVTWRCTADAPGYNRSAIIAAPADNDAAALYCGPPPPPPPPAPPLVVPVTIPPNNELGGVPYHTLEVIVKSTTENGNRWLAGQQSVRVVFRGLQLAVPSGPNSSIPTPAVAAWLPAAANILVYGDSITEGVRALGEQADNDTDRNDATVCWSYRLGALLGAETGVVGFGATGASHGGSGNVPGLTISYDLLWEGVPRVFEPRPDLIVLNEGTNDCCANITAQLVEIVDGLMAACPGTPIALLLPFDGAEAASLQQACEWSANPALCHYIDTSGFLVAKYGIDAPLNLHPTGPNDVARIAPQIAAKLRPLLFAPSGRK